MDPLIDAHITTTYTPEIGVCMFEAFALLDNFDVQDYQEEFISLLMQAGNMHREDLADVFRATVVKWVDFVLKHHMVELTNDCPLRKRVAVLSALYQIQDLQDYTTIAICLESSQDADSKFAFIISELTELTEEEVLEILEHVDPVVLDNLYRYALSKNGDDETSSYLTDSTKAIVEKLVVLEKLNSGRSALGNMLLSNGALPGQRFSNYLPYITGYFDEASKDKSPKELAFDVLSLLCLSADGGEKPLQVFKEFSSQLFSDSVLVTKVDVALLSLVGEFGSFSKAYEHEKNRVS